MARNPNQRLARAVERKKEAAKRASEQADEHSGRGVDLPEEQAGRIEHGRPQDTRSVRAKSAAKKKSTADKWNQ